MKTKILEFRYLPWDPAPAQFISKRLRPYFEKGFIPIGNKSGFDSETHENVFVVVLRQIQTPEKGD